MSVQFLQTKRLADDEADMGSIQHVILPLLSFGLILGSVPSECNLDENCSLAFGLINNNINSNYSDRLINSLKNGRKKENAEWLRSKRKSFAQITIYGNIVDIISNFTCHNKTSIITTLFSRIHLCAFSSYCLQRFSQCPSFMQLFLL